MRSLFIVVVVTSMTFSAHAFEPDDYVSQQLSLRQVRAQEAWDVETGGTTPVVVAILDSGMDWSHPDLVDNLWLNPSQACDSGADDDGNGYIDDCHGWDFVDGDRISDDPLGRGTHIAGIIGARGNNSMGVAGISWSAKLMPLRVMAGSITDIEVNATRATLAVRYAIEQNVDIIHLSFATRSNYGPLRVALQDALNAGIIVVAPAGDDSQNLDYEPLYPAGWDLTGPILIVAALDQGGKLSFASNYGQRAHLGAPGILVFSTTPGSLVGLLSGTPMAAAHVTGACALLRSNQPALSAQQATEKIIRTASKRNILAQRIASEAILDLGLLIADKADPVDAHINAPDSTLVGVKVPFDGTGSEGQVVEYLWKFGDPIDQFGPVVIREWSRPGTVGLELQIRTSDGRTATTQHRISITRGGRNFLGCALNTRGAGGLPIAAAMLALLALGRIQWARSRQSF